MLRFVLASSVIVLVASPVAAQQKPTADQEKAIAGSWTLDASKSDTGEAVFRMGGGGRNNAPAGDAGGGGRGRSRGRTSTAPANTTDTTAVDANAQQQIGYARQAMGDPHMAMVMSDANPGNKLTIVVTDTNVTLTNAAGQSNAFSTDGRKHQEAEMDGSIVEWQASWDGDVLTITRGVVGVVTLKREFRPSKDGNTLEVKESGEAGASKTDKKLVFTRG